MSSAGAADGRQDEVVAGRYRVIDCIGQGGMGRIFRVEHLKLRRHFAMKVLAARLAGNPQALARFHREADIVATLHHPHIVEIVDWETLADGSPCLVMEHLRGQDLARRIGEGPLPWPLIALYGDQILSALTAAHRAGVVHRDLKPANVFLASDDNGETRAKILDFGVSKMRDADSQLTDEDHIIGTPAYMAPEQANGEAERVGPGSDVWAVGAILYEMATGEQAFRGATTPAILYQICFGGPPSLAARRPDAPPGFVAAVERALSRDPARRIEEAPALRALLHEAFAAASPALAPPPLRLAAAAPASLGDLATRPTDEQTRPDRVRVPATDGALRPARRRAGWWVAASIAAIAAAATAIVLAGRDPGPPGAGALPPPAAAPRRPPPPPAAALAARAPDRNVPIAVVGLPAGARLLLDGKPLSGGHLALPDDGSTHVLRALAPGYLDEQRTLTGRRDPTVRFALRPRPGTERPAPERARPAEDEMIDP